MEWSDFTKFDRLVFEWNGRISQNPTARFLNLGCVTSVPFGIGCATILVAASLFFWPSERLPGVAKCHEKGCQTEIVFRGSCQEEGKGEREAHGS